MTQTYLGNIYVDIFNLDSILEKIKMSINKKEPIHIITLNSLMLNYALKDKILADAIASGLVVPDSAGIIWALKFLTGIKLKRLAGIDLLYHICAMAAKNKYKIFLLGSRSDITEKASQNLKSFYSGLDIIGIQHGYYNINEESAIINKISGVKPDILFVGFSVPEQEKWIASNIKKLNIPVIVGIGGSFDVISGNLKRAPLWCQKLNIEWFFRLLQQPWRITRMIDLPVFILNIFKIKIKKHKTAL